MFTIGYWVLWGLSRPCSSLIFSFLRNWQCDLYSGWASLHFHLHQTKVPLSPYFPNILRCVVGFNYKQKVVDHSYNIHDTVVPVGISCQISHYYSSQGSQQGRAAEYFPPVVLLESSGTVKVIQEWWNFQVNANLISLSLNSINRVLLSFWRVPKSIHHKRDNKYLSLVCPIWKSHSAPSHCKVTPFSFYIVICNTHI